MKKRAIMISMLLVMALSVTGCSQKTATKDKDTKTEETAKTDDAEETESHNPEESSAGTHHCAYDPYDHGNRLPRRCTAGRGCYGACQGCPLFRNARKTGMPYAL